MDNISCQNAAFSSIVYFDENANELMRLRESTNKYAIRVPNIGERIMLSSYEHKNDKKPLFNNVYKVIDVITCCSEIKGYKKNTVQYFVTLKKE